MSDIFLPTYSFHITFLVLTMVMIVRYFFVAGIFDFLSSRSGKVLLSPDGIGPGLVQKDIWYSVISSVIFAFFGALLVLIWQQNQTLIYTDFNKYGGAYLVFSLILLLLIHDTYFYWTHRLLHLWKFKKCHYVHHSSVAPTAWTSFSFHPWEAVIQAFILPVMVMIIPVHWSVLVLFLLIMSVCGVINHLGREHLPRFFEKGLCLITASHHQVHHQKVSVNFGLYFTFWDRLMGTESGERNEY